MAPSPPACLCVLCGLPAAGKSSLARTVAVMAATRGWRVAVIHYDDLVPESAFRMKALEDESQAQTEWQLSRRSLLRAVERLLRDPDAASDPPDGQRIDGAAWRRCVRVLLEQRGGGGGSTEAAAAAEPVVLLLDDNFYYPSMRYEVYRLARKCSVGFCQVFVDCCVEACTSRNQRRPDPLPTGLIVEMAKRLEAPNPQKNAWEKNSITLNNSGCLSETDLQRWMELMTHAVHNPLVQVQEDDTEQKEADRLRCAISVVHQADQACRRLVSAVMKSASEDGDVPPEQMKCLASELNESKLRFLQDLRTQYVQQLPTIEGEDIDVQQVVTTEVAALDREIKETLLRFRRK